MLDRKSFFVTITSSQPHGAGYFEVKASNYTTAREATFQALGDKWSFIYNSFEDIHPLDRKCHGIIEGE
jgi:hypothetical protein